MNKDIPIIYVSPETYEIIKKIEQYPGSVIIEAKNELPLTICINKKYKKKQMVVRTYPDNYSNPYNRLQELLGRGYTVVTRSIFDTGLGKSGNEYILEKEVEDEDE